MSVSKSYSTNMSSLREQSPEQAAAAMELVELCSELMAMIDVDARAHFVNNA